jgi:TonB-dependent SusC/RagA subfamily outer membrane receptor
MILKPFNTISMYKFTLKNWVRFIIAMSKQVFLAWVVAISFGGVLAAHNGNSQKLLSDFTITLKEENSGLFKVLNKIEKQTNFKFAYLDELSNKIVVSVDADNATLDKVLESIGKSGKVTFRRVNDMIAVSKAKEALLKNFVEEIPFVNVDITGKITDENNQGLPGASVVVKGTTNGTTTDLDGNYKLTVPEEATIILSFVGYLTQEVILGTRTVLDLQMQLDAEQLQEVVVTALGIKKDRKTLGYATSNVASKEFTENRTPNFVNALQGKIAGVNITTMGSGPQGSSKIRIRGISSFGGSNSPLIIVNGVPIDNTNFGNQGNGGNQGEVGSNRRSDGGDGLSSINPDDVTSMTVLKGAAASALYGSRAKDGVIMITTRKALRVEACE